MKILAAQCPDCEVIIWSRCLRDTHSCECTGLTVTGGPTSPKFSGEYADNKHTVFAEMQIDDIPDEDLYNDWASGEKQHGWFYVVEEELGEDHD
jgi:hypothetical protein